MKLRTAINKAPKVFVYVHIGGDESHQLQVSKKNAREIVETWLDDERFDEYWYDDISGRIVATILDDDNTGNVYLG